MGSSLMRATKPAQPAEPAEVPDMASDTNQIIETDAPQSQNDEVDQSMPPVPPEMGPSPTKDVSNVELALDPPPGNWEARQDDVYTQRQQVSGPPMVNLDAHSSPVSVPKMANSDESNATSVPGAAPKARGPPLSISEATPAVTITVPLPLRQRMNPHMPPQELMFQSPRCLTPFTLGELGYHFR